MTKIALLALLTLAACNTARTAYSLDHSQSWTCIPNTSVQPPIRGAEPLVLTAPKPDAPAVAQGK